LRALLDIPGHEIEPMAFAQAFNLTAAAAQALFAAQGAVPIGKARVLPEARIARIEAQVRAALAEFQLAHPEVGGMTPRELRARLGEAVSAEALAAILRQLIDRDQIEQSGARLRLPGQAASFSAAEQAQWRQLEAWLDARGPRPFALAEAMAELRLGEPATRALLYRRRLNGDLWQLPNQRLLARAHVARLAAQAAALSEASAGGFTAAQFRDVSGIGRNMVIDVLEFFDAIGVTSRRNTVRVTHPDYAAVVGQE
jgi:selenocysteine-specific elongation factor